MTSTSLKGEQPITALHDIVDHVIIACCVVIGRCNKVQCTVCGTNMCWLCGKAISGYDHFNSANAKCILFDTLDGDHHWYNPRPPYNPNANREAPVVSLTPLFKFLSTYGRVFIDFSRFQEHQRIVQALEMDPTARRNVLKCPRCGMQNMRSSTNNHMRCWNCRRNFCFQCKTLISGVIAEHFNAAQPCNQHSTTK